MPVLNSVTESYSYSSHDRLTAAGSKSYGYDGAGNCTSVTVGSAVTSLTWNDDERLTGITYPSTATNSFSYNGEGLRVGKVDSAGTSSPITDGTAPASAVLKDARAVYTPGLSERTTGTGAASKFYHGDALGSTRGITNSSQAVTDAVLYDAFGMTVSRTGTTATPFGFVGAAQYQSDADSGLQLLGNRLFDPSIGRFISSDPAKAGTNFYGYCENDPVQCTDPSGLDAWGDIGSFIGGLGKGIGNSLIPDMRSIILPIVVNDNHFYDHYWDGPAQPVFPIGSSPSEQAGATLGGGIGFGVQIGGMLIGDEGVIGIRRGPPPELPPSTIYRRGEVVIDHYHGSVSGEHGPPHAHVVGGGPSTKIGSMGYPLRGQPALSPVQERAVREGLPAIRRALRQIGRWHRYYNPK